MDVACCELNIAATRCGAVRSIPLLETRFPFYGFKDFTASFPQVGRIWEQDDGGLVEIAEQAVNGRRFSILGSLLHGCGGRDGEHGWGSPLRPIRT